MEFNKDIGTRIKDRLSDAEVPLDGALWNRIEGSLEDRDRRRRNLMILWFTGGAVAVLLFMLLLKDSGPAELNSEPSMDNEDLIITKVDSILESGEFNSEKTITFQQIESYMTDSLNVQTKNVLDAPKIDSNGKGENLDTSTKLGDVNIQDLFSQENSTTKTVYHYYNSETKEVFETTDKNIIDSLIDHGNKETDSVQVYETRYQNLKKKDSMG